MSQLLVDKKQIVVPGQIVAEGMDFLPANGTYRKDDKIVSSRVGLTFISGRAIKIIPLAGRYLPKENDTVIGKVIDIMMSGWRVDINSAYDSVLSMREATSDFIKKGEDLTRYFNFGDYIITKIVNVTSQNLVDVTMKGPGLRKITTGRIVKVTPCKVPRIIGKGGSMISMIKKACNVKLVVGQNGLIWLDGDKSEEELLAIETIKMIEENSHISGLTNIIKEFLEEKTGTQLGE